MVSFVVVDPPGGGIGNLLFQHNIGYALALQHNATLIIRSDDSVNALNTYRPPFIAYKQLFQHVQFMGTNMLQSMSQCNSVSYYEENGFKYSPPSFNVGASMLVLKGYFQSYKYFHNHWQQIKDTLINNTKDIYTSIANKYNIISNNKKTVCVHIRRTDYLKTPDYHSIIGEDYYEKALENFNDYKWLIFSDDIESIKHWKLWKNKECVFVDEIEPLRTLYLMSMCDAFVIANSSMSLNAYYFRKILDAPIYIPKNWFGKDGPSFDINDLVENAIII